jgi:hypothetical protein
VSQPELQLVGGVLAVVGLMHGGLFRVLHLPSQLRRPLVDGVIGSTKSYLVGQQTFRGP